MCRKFFLLISFVLVLGFAGKVMATHPQGITFEWWFDIDGTAISDLTGQASYPDSPDEGEIRESFDGPVDWLDNYGTRARGWLNPTDDGEYTFWISGDDYQELYLSTDDDPANAALIAQVPGWTGHLEWTKYPEQQSEPITLAAGGSYYIEALMKEGGGGDSLAVGWTGPGIGDETTVIAGAYVTPAPFAPSLHKARNPVPADGAVDADVTTVEWQAGVAAVSHAVYLDGELVAETDQLFAAVTLDPGTTYTWQVNEVEEDGTVIEGDLWTFTTLPLEAHFPSPADGAEDVASPVTLSWTPGKSTVINQVYFGNDKALVDARDPSTSKGNIVQKSVSVGNVELFSTYYWAVDEFTPMGTVAGPVWSFSTEKYVSLLTGSQALNYDNTAEPYVSELALDTPADLTAEGVVSDLTLKFQGMGPDLSIDEETGTYQITGEGADIWGGSDAFHYVYMQLTGDGEISARVVSNGTGSNTWAKGGVMIRETTAPDSRQMLMGMTGGDGGGIAFQGRIYDTGGNSSSLHGDITAAPPTWVKLTRTGNEITAYYSADGETWDLFTGPADTSGGDIANPQTVDWPETVLIGLFVTSHQDGELRTYTFDNVDVQGDVDGVIVSKDIASVSGNSAEPIYVSLEDSTGAVASVAHPYAAATQITAQRDWTIPLSAFEGVDPTMASKLYIGVGNGEPGGVGVLTVSDIRVVEPVPPGDITQPSDIIEGVPNDGDWPGGEYPALAFDNNVNTKYLHFKGDFDPDPGTGGAGLRITPLDGPTVVTEITLTTANDVPGRDPVAFALYGSNDGIDGSYELIAEGDVVDFAGEAAWPRYTKNETPITFANSTAYSSYQLIFTAIRGPVGGSVNSMQIAEVELLEGAGAPYMYDGDSLDGWDHDNNSDEWDGTAPGEGNPGGAGLFVEDDVTFLRIQDIGDPRSLGISDPSNRKIYLTQQISKGLDGAHMEFKLRVATTPPLDDQVSGDPWPEGGIGYHIRDGGKGMVGIAETGVGQIAFSLAKAGEIEGIDTDALVVNGLLGTESSGDVDTGDAATPNSIAIDDATAWNTITVDIAAGGAGTHVLTISINGGDAVSVDVTAGDALDGDNNYVAIGSSGTGGTTAFDVDYISVE
jgi:hypothetical protein